MRVSLDFKPGLPARMGAEIFDMMLAEDAYPVCIAIVRDVTGAVKEVVIEPLGKIGKSGSDLERIFENLGIGISRAIQGRDPQTGAALDAGAVAKEDDSSDCAADAAPPSQSPPIKGGETFLRALGRRVESFVKSPFWLAADGDA